MRLFIALAAFLISLVPGAPVLHAATCTAKDFAAAVDQSGASLRAMTLEAQPKLQERMRRYRAVKKLGDDYEDTALDAIQNPKLAAFDEKSSALLLTVDSLGRVPEGTEPDCAKLAQLKSAAAELNTVIKAKSDYMLQRLDEKIAQAEKGATPAKPDVKTAETKKNLETTARTPPAVPRPSPPVPAPAKPAPQDWAASTKPNDAHRSPDVAMREPDVSAVLPPPEQEGYTIDEIREVTRGFFGTISTNLASVIEHAFKQSGRPTAYVLGTEGGGAFLAGLRFGKGTLYMRSLPGTRQVYWHGPSLGTDFGASGSRTLFLIYRMQTPDAPVPQFHRHRRLGVFRRRCRGDLAQGRTSHHGADPLRSRRCGSEPTSAIFVSRTLRPGTHSDDEKTKARLIAGPPPEIHRVNNATYHQSWLGPPYA